jgi:hypothetical protein
MGPSNRLRYRLRRLVDCVELSAQLPDGADELTLRIEIFECAEPPRYYCARVWRLEMYRLQSTFPQLPGGVPRHRPSDELILKEFEGFHSTFEEPISFPDASTARNAVLDELADWLGSIGATDRWAPGA